MAYDKPLPASAGWSSFRVVAIGASAGGITALDEVLAALPQGLPAAVLVVQHLDPRRRSRLARLLGRHAHLAVEEAADGQALRAGTVYVAPPDRHLLVRDGAVSLAATPTVHFSRPSVDRLFESIADEYAGHAIAVIFSGTGSDGADGLRVIKDRGGVTIAEDPLTAAHRGMPAAAVATGCVDFTLPLHAIGPAIARLVLDHAGLAS